MPTPVNIFPGDEDEGINFRLWLGILLPPFAGGINTLVGYMVSNYDCNVHNRHLVLVVNVVSVLLCVMATRVPIQLGESLKTEQTMDQNPCFIHDAS